MIYDKEPTWNDNEKWGYCPICDKKIVSYTDDSMCYCPTCGHHINLHEEEE